jgi:hypothetical protein
MTIFNIRRALLNSWLKDARPVEGSGEAWLDSSGFLYSGDAWVREDL